MILKMLKPFISPASLRSGAVGKGIEALHSLTKDLKNDAKIHSLVKDKYIILGVPDDRGVVANQGKPGASKGPEAFRKEFYALYDSRLRDFHPSTHRPSPIQNSEENFLSEKFLDAGDLILENTIHKTHENLAQVIEFFLNSEVKKIFVIGGGHDFSYGSYKGHVLSRKDEVIPIVNLDAHFDLRPMEDNQINSGTAFSRIINDFGKNIAEGKALLEMGIQRERNPDALYKFVEQNKIPTVEYFALLHIWRDLHQGHAQEPLEHIHDHLDDCAALGYQRTSGSVHLSLDLDIFAQFIAPGTSASTPFGIQIRDIAPSLAFLGKSQFCRVIDIAELCPDRDELNQTARLAASLVYRFAILQEEY